MKRASRIPTAPVLSLAAIACLTSAPRSASAQVRARDLAKLRWIEGAWIGSGAEKPFFECYQLLGDSALHVVTFTDSAFTRVEDTTRFVVREGRVGNWDADSRWAASEIGDRSITFSPVARARNTFSWRYRSADAWTALLTWPARDSTPARERRYEMTRAPRRGACPAPARRATRIPRPPGAG